MRLNTSILVILALAIAPLESLRAQSTFATPVGPIRVTLVLRKGASGSTEALRRANRQPANVVLLGESASAEDLAAALRAMSALRIRYGDKLTRDVRSRVQSSTLSPEWPESEYRRWLIGQLERLRAAPVRKVGDLGFVQAVYVTLPARSARATFQSNLRR